MPREITVALSSIPNTGKTTLFNRLTGSRQSTGNWPGVSVEKRTGQFSLGECLVTLIDLPGAYALAPLTEENQVVRDYFLHDPPDIVLNILDARNLYRGLGLTLQMAMSGLPMVVAVNMMDEARRQGIKLDLGLMSEHLGIPVVPISARSGEGMPELMEALYQVIRQPDQTRPPHISCPPVLEEAIKDLARKINLRDPEQKLNQNFIAMRLLEEEEPKEFIDDPEIAASVRSWRTRIKKITQSEIPVTCSRCRFNAARGLVLEATHERPTPPDALSECIDSILLNRWLGLPLFLLIMLFLFQAIYGLGTPMQGYLSRSFDAAEAWLRDLSRVTDWPAWLQSFAFDGLWQGLGVVTSFFPIIALFFIFMSLIEDSGYMARAAFLMDRLMHHLGLDGKAFINLLLGYGCNVPAVMGTRILSSHYSRIVTMLLIPFTLCSARLQVFVFLVGILFAPAHAPWVLLALYLGSFASVVLIGLLLKSLRIAGSPEPFIMEIPPYRMPTLHSVALRSWQELKDFLYRAATLIMLGVVIVWFLTHFPVGATAAASDTWAAQIGRFLSSLFAPLGIGWQETIALIFGFIAKEIVIGAIAIIYGGADLASHLAAHITPLQGLSFMVFTLLYTPCIATVAAIRAESGSWKITFLSIFLGLSAAWLSSLLIFQGGRLFGFE